MKKIYLAGPFFDDEQLNLVKEIERALTVNPTVSEFFSPRKGSVNNTDEIGSDHWAKATFEKDISEIRKADAIVAILDYPHDNPDSGTAFEIGYAYSLDKPIVLLHTADNAINLMISQAARAYLKSIKELKTYNFNTLPVFPYSGKNF